MPDESSRFQLNGEPLFHFMGTSTFANTSWCPACAGSRSVRPTRPSTRSATSAAASPPASGPVLFSGQGQGGQGWWSSAPAASGSTCQAGAKMVCQQDHRRGHQRRAGRRRGALDDGLHQPQGRRRVVDPSSTAMTDGGADVLLRVRRQCAADAPGLTAASAGALHHHRRGGRRQEIARLPARHRPQVGRAAFGGARGRTDVPKIVDWYMDGRSCRRRADHPKLPLGASTRFRRLMRRANPSAPSSVLKEVLTDGPPCSMPSGLHREVTWPGAALLP